jgi:hypothetical protein
MPKPNRKLKGSRRFAGAHGYAVTSHGSVWMTDDQACISAARAVAVDAMRSLGMDEGDWRTRDNIIMAISDRINGMLEYVRHNQLLDSFLISPEISILHNLP